MYLHNLDASQLLAFLHKYFFILKAASEGWRIAYIGGNAFQFYNNLYKQGKAMVRCKEFIDRYDQVILK
jgi:hypothetical protein